jgi:hypothetical protein
VRTSSRSTPICRADIVLWTSERERAMYGEIQIDEPINKLADDWDLL